MSLQDYIFQHLILRTMDKNDIDDLKEWISDISLYEYWGKRPSKSEKNPEVLFSKPEKATKSFHWGMAKVAFRLSKQYQGNGLMSEALKSIIEFCFSKTELQKIWTDVHILNHASYKTLEKVGFQREGHIRGGKMVNTYCDYYLYGILKSDYITS